MSTEGNLDTVTILRENVLTILVCIQTEAWDPVIAYLLVNFILEISII